MVEYFHVVMVAMLTQSLSEFGLLDKVYLIITPDNTIFHDLRISNTDSYLNVYLSGSED